MTVNTQAVVRRTLLRRWGLPTNRRRASAMVWLSWSVLVVALLVGVVGSWLAPHDPHLPDIGSAWLGSDQTHLLGYDAQGRDILSRLLAGARPSLIGPLGLMALSMALGVGVGVACAWFRGPVDRVVSGVLDILFAFPALLLAVLAAAVFGAGVWSATIALAVAYTPYVARIVRSAALRERCSPYIEALEVQGASTLGICLRHVLPNLRPLIVAQSTLLFGWAMVDLAAVSFLGLGSQPPNADWGIMIQENLQGIIQGYPTASLSAAACIVAVVIAVNVVGYRLLERAEG